MERVEPFFKEKGGKLEKGIWNERGKKKKKKKVN